MKKTYMNPRIDADIHIMESAVLALSTEHTQPVQDEFEEEIIDEDAPFTF